MLIKAIAPWFGSKRGLASEIVRQLGPHSAYWEPFCGSLAVLLAKPPVGHETINDLHGDLINLARIVQSPTWAPVLYERLKRTLAHEDLLREARETFRGEDPPLDPLLGPAHVDRAYVYFVTSWLGRNGVSGTARSNYQMAIRWTPHGGGGGQRFVSAINSLPAWHERLRRVLILRRDAFEIIEKIEDVAGVAIYVDPPYLHESMAGGSRYEHDFAAGDHRRLADMLARFRAARVVVSYYDHAQLAELYPAGAWHKLDRQRNKNLHVQNRRGSQATIAPEVLLVNGEPIAEESAGSLFAGGNGG